MAFQEVCEEVVTQTEGVLGCLLVDLRTGLAVASAQRSGVELDETQIRSILRSSGELFRGKLIEQFARSLPTERASSTDFVREVQITKVDTYQFMATIPDWEEVVVILLAERTLSLGFGWMVVRQAQHQFSEARRTAVSESRRRITDRPPSPVLRNDATQTAAPQQPIRQPEPIPEPPSPPEAPVTSESVDSKPQEPSLQQEQEREPDQPIVSGPRAKMFRSRSGKR